VAQITDIAMMLLVLLNMFFLPSMTYL